MIATRSCSALCPLAGHLRSRALHTTSVLAIKRAGRHKISKTGDKPLTYEEANKPDQIGVRKSWNSINASSVVQGIREAETAHEDLLIRKFIHGTWPRLMATEVIIKRRANQIILSFIAVRAITPAKMYFLIGYTEEILSYILKSIVRIELQTTLDHSDVTYKYI